MYDIQLSLFSQLAVFSENLTEKYILKSLLASIIFNLVSNIKKKNIQFHVEKGT